MSPSEQLSLLFPADITASKRRKPNPLHQAEALPVLGRLILTARAEGESCLALATLWPLWSGS